MALIKSSLFLVTAAIAVNNLYSQNDNLSNGNSSNINSSTSHLASRESVKNNAAIFQQINQEVLANSAAYERLSDASKTIGHRLTGSENGKAYQAIYLRFYETQPRY